MTKTQTVNDTINQRALLAWLGVPRVKLRRWERERGFPRLAGKAVGYSKGEVVAWLVAEVTAPEREHIDQARRGDKHVVEYMGQVASFFGVAPATVRSWVSNGCPGEVGSAKQPGRFDLGEMTRWVRDRDGDRFHKQHRQHTHGDVDRVAKLKGDKLDIELRRLNGEVVDRRAAELWLAGYIRRVRDLLERVPGEVAGQTPPAMRAEVESNICGYVAAILAEAASWRIDAEVEATMDANDDGSNWTPDNLSNYPGQPEV